MIKNFSDTGYAILRNAINDKLIKEVQSKIYNLLDIDDDIQKNQYKRFCNFVKKIKTTEFEFIKPIFEYIYHKGLIEKILLEKKLYNSIVDLLGKDLSFCNDHSITLNIPLIKVVQKKIIYLKIGIRKFGRVPIPPQFKSGCL